MNIKNLKFFSFVFLLFVVGCSFCGQQKIIKQQNLCFAVLTDENKPTQALSALLSYFKIDHNGTLGDIVEKTQKTWLRPSNVERFNMQEPYADKMNELKPVFVELGLVNEVTPQSKNYDYVVILGASLPTARIRISWLIKLWNDGIRFKKVFVLTGQRPLDSEKETLAMLDKEYVNKLRVRNPFIGVVRSDWKIDSSMKFETESDMMKLIYEQSDMPEVLRQVEVVFIESPMKESSAGKKIRPNTADTLKDWLKTNPEKGTILAISSQPTISYQYSVIKSVLPKQFDLEVVGCGLPEEYESVSIILDSLARVLYQEQIRLKN